MKPMRSHNSTELYTITESMQLIGSKFKTYFTQGNQFNLFILLENPFNTEFCITYFNSLCINLKKKHRNIIMAKMY